MISEVIKMKHLKIYFGKKAFYIKGRKPRLIRKGGGLWLWDVDGKEVTQVKMGKRCFAKVEEGLKIIEKDPKKRVVSAIL